MLNPALAYPRECHLKSWGKTFHDWRPQAASTSEQKYNNSMTSIAIIGAGAIGSVLGALLCREGHEVTLIARSEHVHAIRQDGLFIVPDATKDEIKKAVELLFEVGVEGVQVVNNKGKTKRTNFGRTKRKDWKKAYVRLKAGDDINFLGTE